MQPNQLKKPCKYCVRMIDYRAKVCPVCRRDLRVWIVRHPFLALLAALFGTPFLFGAVVLGCASSLGNILVGF